MSKTTRLRFRNETDKNAEHNLLAATQRWLRANGGEAVVIGGIGIMADPLTDPYRFSVVVSVTGRRPERKASDTRFSPQNMEAK